MADGDEVTDGLVNVLADESVKALNHAVDLGKEVAGFGLDVAKGAVRLVTSPVGIAAIVGIGAAATVGEGAFALGAGAATAGATTTAAATTTGLASSSGVSAMGASTAGTAAAGSAAAAALPIVAGAAVVAAGVYASVKLWRNLKRPVTFKSAPSAPGRGFGGAKTYGKKPDGQVGGKIKAAVPAASTSGAATSAQGNGVHQSARMAAAASRAPAPAHVPRRTLHRKAEQ